MKEHLLSNTILFHISAPGYDHAHQHTALVMQVLWHIMFHRLQCKSLCGSLREMLSPVFCMSTCVLLYCIEGVIRMPCRWLTQQVALKSVCKLRLMRGGFDFPLISLSKAWPPMWGMAALNANPLLLSCVSQCDHDYKVLAEQNVRFSLKNQTHTWYHTCNKCMCFCMK